MKENNYVQQYMKYMDETIEFETLMHNTIKSIGEKAIKLKEENERLRKIIKDNGLPLEEENNLQKLPQNS